MNRYEMAAIIGIDYLVGNIEESEFKYSKDFKKRGENPALINHTKTKGNYDKLDMRFVAEKDNVSVLIETKDDVKSTKTIYADAKKQLSAYVDYEKRLTGNHIIAILASTNVDYFEVYINEVAEENFLAKETTLKSMSEYIKMFKTKVANDKAQAIKGVYGLNEILHKYGIPENIRAQFFATCIIALNRGIKYDAGMTTKQIIGGIEDKVNDALNATNNAESKFSQLCSPFENQAIKKLTGENFTLILNTIKNSICKYYDPNTSDGQDILSVCFTAFNKYVGKSDKNQAFTPEHITDFMAKITGVDRNSRVLDPCCGSGSFLVKSMLTALKDCNTPEEQYKVKNEHIFGIEYDKYVAGLALSNLILHDDGNSNIMQDSCFDKSEWIKNAVRPNIILMNPPYNCTASSMDKNYTKLWKKSQNEDPSKGLYFVKWIGDIISECNSQVTLAVLLPVACAIGTDGEIKRMKEEILKKNTLEAVFTLPDQIFNPGASASVCCMVFTLNKPHAESNKKTFFGYYKEDGFTKKKNLGRIEQLNADGSSKWAEIETQWIDLYKNHEIVDGLSITAKVTADDEWLCEAYMKTDYSKLTEADFQQTMNNYLAYLMKEGKVYES